MQEPKVRRNPAVAALLLVGVAFVPFASRPAIIGGDEPHFALMSHSIAIDRNFSLAENYREVAAGSKAAGSKWAGRQLDHHVREVAGRTVFSHPIGLPILTAPLLWALQQISPGSAPDLILGALAAVVSALGVAAGWDVLRRTGSSRWVASATVFTVFFTTPLWYYSRTVFTEPYLWALTTIATWAVVTRRWIAASVIIGLLPLVKETAIISSAVLVIGVLVFAGWARSIMVAQGLVVAAAVFVARNLCIYGHVYETFQPYTVGDPIGGAQGLLLDARHGLVPFAPVLLAALAGWAFLRPSTPRRRVALALAGGLVILWFAVTAFWIDWSGGSCYGPRLLVPALPALAVPLVEIWRRAHEHRWIRALLAATVPLGFAIQWCAVTDPFHAFWSVTISDLMTAQPVRTIIGLAIGISMTSFLLRRLLRDTG